MRRLTSIPSLFALALLAVAGCGKKADSYTVNGQTLVVNSTNYGQDSYFCNNLANGQYEIVISDFALCDELAMDAGNRKVFHSMDETNIRIIFPSFLKVPPNVNSFNVANDPGCFIQGGNNPNGAEAVFVFSHQTGSNAKYDAEVQADSGTITVTSSPDMIKNFSEIKGTFDVMIGGSHLTGNFDALNCKGVVAGVGD
jgi:hypothetical protein